MRLTFFLVGWHATQSSEGLCPVQSMCLQSLTLCLGLLFIYIRERSGCAEHCKCGTCRLWLEVKLDHILLRRGQTCGIHHISLGRGLSNCQSYWTEWAFSASLHSYLSRDCASYLQESFKKYSSFVYWIKCNYCVSKNTRLHFLIGSNYWCPDCRRFSGRDIRVPASLLPPLLQFKAESTAVAMYCLLSASVANIPFLVLFLCSPSPAAPFFKSVKASACIPGDSITKFNRGSHKSVICSGLSQPRG